MGTSPALAEDEITFVTNWRADFYSSAFTLQWADAFNADHEGVAQIRFVGGPEVTPAREQFTATRNGVFDLLFGASGYYLGQVPEAYALAATQMTPVEARERGALDLLADIYREKTGVEVLGWVAAGVGYHVWLKDAEVAFGDDGLPDLTGLKIRTSPLYNAWLDTMGATLVPMPAPEVYSGLERGVVDGAAWPGLGVTDFGWHRFIGARIDPGVFQFDNLLWMNGDAWSALSPDSRAALKASVIQLERDALAHYAELVAAEHGRIAEAGTVSIALTGAARDTYLANAREIMWGNLEAAAPENYARLREAFGG